MNYLQMLSWCTVAFTTIYACGMESNKNQNSSQEQEQKEVTNKPSTVVPNIFNFPKPSSNKNEIDDDLSSLLKKQATIARPRRNAISMETLTPDELKNIEDAVRNKNKEEREKSKRSVLNFKGLSPKKTIEKQ